MPDDDLSHASLLYREKTRASHRTVHLPLHARPIRSLAPCALINEMTVLVADFAQKVNFIRCPAL